MNLTKDLEKLSNLKDTKKKDYKRKFTELQGGAVGKYQNAQHKYMWISRKQGENGTGISEEIMAERCPNLVKDINFYSQGQQTPSRINIFKKSPLGTP